MYWRWFSGCGRARNLSSHSRCARLLSLEKPGSTGSSAAKGAQGSARQTHSVRTAKKRRIISPHSGSEPDNVTHLFPLSRVRRNKQTPDANPRFETASKSLYSGGAVSACVEVNQ